MSMPTHDVLVFQSRTRVFSPSSCNWSASLRPGGLGQCARLMPGRRPALQLVVSFALALSLCTAAAQVHVWEKVELTFHAKNFYANPYTNVDVWADLKGPDFAKRCYEIG